MAETPKPKGGNVLTQKAGPLPIWAWALAGGALIFGVYRWRQAKAQQASQLNLPATADVGMASQGAPLGGWGGGGGGSTLRGAPAAGPSPSTGASGGGTDGQAVPPIYQTPPVSPNGTAAPIIGTNGQPLPGSPLPQGTVALPQPTEGSGFAGTMASAGNLGPGQSGVLPNGLRVTRTVDSAGHVLYTYS